MPAVEISRSKEPIRLFKSDALEFFTHISPVTVLAFWVPVVAAFMVWAIVGAQGPAALAYIPLCFVIGLFLWTLAEYMLHRFVFHYHPKTEWGKRISFLLHGVHHAQPMVKTRLVMPPPVSVPLALVFFGAFYLLLGIALGVPQWVAPLFAGFVTGYVAYDMMHYSTHHFKSNWAYWQFMKRYHMHHHVQTPEMRFGVTSVWWDVVFRTRPAE
jgi:sterol desaturase/sphingolipid hydroxylase (fatty acid hydroxylase superfamily)